MPKLSLSPVWYDLGTTWIGGIKIFYGELTAKSVVVDNVGPNNKFGRVQWSWSGDRCWVFLAGLYLCISVFSFVCLCIWPINQSFIQLRNPIGFSNRKIDIDKNCIDKHCIGLDGKKNQYQFQHFRRTEHNFFRLPFSFAEKNLIRRDKRLHSVFSSVSSNYLPKKRQSHANCIYLTFIHCAFLNVSSNCLRRGKVTLVAFVWLLSSVRFQMIPQIACIIKGIVALVTFVFLFTTVHFQMCPQSTWRRADIFALVALIWLFSIVGF